jgi:hypothetical protein
MVDGAKPLQVDVEDSTGRMKTELEEHELSLDKEDKVLEGIRDSLKGKVPALLSFCSNRSYWICTAISPSPSPRTPNFLPTHFRALHCPNRRSRIREPQSRRSSIS